MQNFRGAGAMRRQQLTETQALFDPPTEPRELIRHMWTASWQVVFDALIAFGRLRSYVRPVGAV
jgi:hypothetical protein